MGFRQGAGNGASASLGTIPQALGSAVLQGSKLVAYIVGGATTTNIVSGVSDTINGSTGWVQVVGSSAAESSGPTSGEIWVNPNSAAGAAPTITATFKASQGFRAIIVHEVTGCDPAEGASAPASARSQVSVTNFTTANVTPTKNGSYIFGACSNDIDSTVPTAGGAFTLEQTTTTQVCGSEDQVQSVAAAIGANFNFAAAKSGVVNVVAFAPAPTGAQAPLMLPLMQVTPTGPRGLISMAMRMFKTPSPDVPVVVSSILQRRTLHDFGTHAGGRSVRGDS